MKKLVFALLVLLSTNFVLAQQVKMALTEGEFVINRNDNLVWIDVYLSNEEAVKEMTFHVQTTASAGQVVTEPIPAYMVGEDGQNDPTKWTDVSRLSQGIFRYFTDGKPEHWLGRSLDSRKIMQFFVKFQNDIPQTGTINIKFYNISAIGVNGGSDINLTVPESVEITIDIGNKPPDEGDDSVKIRLTPVVDSYNHQVKLTWGYSSVKNPVGKIMLNLSMPIDLTEASIKAHGTNHFGQITKTSSDNIYNYYQVSIDATSNAFGLTPRGSYALMAEITFNYSTTSFGQRQGSAINFIAMDNLGNNLKVGPNINLNFNLGQAETQGEVTYSAQFSVDRKVLEAYIDFYYQGDSFDQIFLFMKLPNKVFPLDVLFEESGSYQLNNLGNNNYQFIITFDQYLNQSNYSKKLMTIILSFDKSVEGAQTITVSNLSAKKGTQTLKVNGQFNLTVDFGKNQVPPDENIVKYLLTKSTPNWISPVSYMRQNGKGQITFDMWMDNVQEVTGAINFDVVLPTYMSLSQVVPIFDGVVDVTKKTGIKKINETTYRVVYSSVDANHPLLPNPQSENPRVIMKLVIDFVDLPPGSLTFLVNNIVASGLDGRKINETREMSITINFLTDVYKFFRKGDLNQQFGDGQLTEADVDMLIKIISNQITPTMYQLWAADLNGDGKIDSYDLTILQQLIKGTGVDDQIITGNTWQVIGKQFTYKLMNENRASLNVYTITGQLLYQQTQNSNHGQFDLNQLQSGLYLIKLNNTTGKIVL